MEDECICSQTTIEISCVRPCCLSRWSEEINSEKIKEKCSVHSQMPFAQNTPRLCQDCMNDGYVIQYISYGFDPKFEVVRRCSVLYGMDK